MKAKLLAALVATLLLAGTIYITTTLTPHNMEPVSAAPEIAEKGEAFPDLTFTTQDGQALRVQDMKEKTILVHFWAAWCAPCRVEFPALLDYVARANGAIGLIAVSMDDHYEDSQKLLEKISKQDTPVYVPHVYWVWDKSKDLSLHAFNTVKVPETIVVNARRQMIDKIAGPGPWGKQVQP